MRSGKQMECGVTMADIEERAEKWAEDYIRDNDMPEWYGAWKDSLIAAYLAGSAQTQEDYVQYIKDHSGQ